MSLVVAYVRCVTNLSVESIASMLAEETAYMVKINIID
jgi:hypothetical protein